MAVKSNVHWKYVLAKFQSSGVFGRKIPGLQLSVDGSGCEPDSWVY